MELVSVIIPCYNQGAYIEECIDSIENQSYKKIEIIIVNDGSDDEKTINILDKISIQNNIKIITCENNGVSEARNIGIANSNGKYILPIDADDKIHSTYIEKCVKILDCNIADIVYCLCRRFGEDDRLLYLREFSEKEMLNTNTIFCSAMYRREHFNKTNGYNSNMKYGYEDWDFWLSMLENNEIKVYRISEVLFYYRIKEKSRNNNMLKKAEEYLKAKEQMKNNHEKLFIKYKEEIEADKKISNKIIRKITILVELGKLYFYGILRS